MMKRRTVLKGGLLAAAAGFAPARLRAEEGPYVLGTLFPMAGPNAEYGTIFTEGAELALKHVAEDKMLRRPIGARAEVITVNGGGVGPDLAGLSPYYWNVIPLASAEVPRIAPYLVSKGFKRLAMMYMNDPFGIGVFKAMQTELPKAGGQLVGSYTILPTDQQFAGVAARIRDTKPDAVYFASYGAQQAQIIKQLRDNGIDRQLVTYSGASIPSVLNLPQ